MSISSSTTATTTTTIITVAIDMEELVIRKHHLMTIKTKNKNIKR